MGQPVTFLRSTSPKPGVVRFELNRTLTGMGHEHYRQGQEILGNRPADELARRMLATGKIAAVHVYGSMVTAEMSDSDPSAVEEVIADLYTYYVPGVEIPPDSELMSIPA